MARALQTTPHRLQEGRALSTQQALRVCTKSPEEKTRRPGALPLTSHKTSLCALLLTLLEKLAYLDLEMQSGLVCFFF